MVKVPLSKKYRLRNTYIFVVDGLRIHNLCRYCLKTSTLRNPSSADMFANKISNNLVRVNGKGALIKKVSLEEHIYLCC